MLVRGESVTRLFSCVERLLTEGAGGANISDKRRGRCDPQAGRKWPKRHFAMN